MMVSDEPPSKALLKHVLKCPNSWEYMGVSKNRGIPKSSILIGFSIINHPFWSTIIFGNTRDVLLLLDVTGCPFHPNRSRLFTSPE